MELKLLPTQSFHSYIFYHEGANPAISSFCAPVSFPVHSLVSVHKMDWEVTTLDFGITGVAAITVLCFLLGQAVKATGKLCRWIPVICGAAGCILGILGWKLIPDFPAFDPITAAAVGVVSGFAATGVHQVYKQIKG